VLNLSRLFAASQVQAASGPSGDLLGGLGRSSTPIPGGSSSSTNSGPFDSIIAIGVLIKGDTVHFEHIAESVSRGLMRVQLDFGVPVIFGLLVRTRAKVYHGKSEDSDGVYTDRFE
jgi:6,7-dimethyl-8-ribityllumazine synthase